MARRFCMTSTFHTGNFDDHFIKGAIAIFRKLGMIKILMWLFIAILCLQVHRFWFGVSCYSLVLMTDTVNREITLLGLKLFGCWQVLGQNNLDARTLWLRQPTSSFLDGHGRIRSYPDNIHVELFFYRGEAWLVHVESRNGGTAAEVLLTDDRCAVVRARHEGYGWNITWPAFLLQLKDCTKLWKNYFLAFILSYTSQYWMCSASNVV